MDTCSIVKQNTYIPCYGFQFTPFIAFNRQQPHCCSEKKPWRNTISINGLLFEDLGITYAHPNGVTKSALDHIYYSNKSIAKNCRKLKNCRDCIYRNSNHYKTFYYKVTFQVLKTNYCNCISLKVVK